MSGIIYKSVEIIVILIRCDYLKMVCLGVGVLLLIIV